MILVLGLSFTNFCRWTRKLDPINFLEINKFSQYYKCHRLGYDTKMLEGIWYLAN